MHLSGSALIFSLLFLSAGSTLAAVFESGPREVPLIELYTSEGCSSCPPAERWLSSLREDEKLWKEYVPVAFHVTYWDYLGWKDSLASPAYSRRQQEYADVWGSDSVYTPAVIMDGRAMRDWGRGGFLRGTGRDGGRLYVEAARNGDFRISFVPPASEAGEKWEAHLALLGFGIRSEVRAGENRGKTLAHDFTVLAYKVEEMKESEKILEVRTLLDRAEGPEIEALGAAVWITRAGRPEPVQAAGGYLL